MECVGKATVSVSVSLYPSLPPRHSWNASAQCCQHLWMPGMLRSIYSLITWNTAGSFALAQPWWSVRAGEQKSLPQALHWDLSRGLALSRAPGLG